MKTVGALPVRGTRAGCQVGHADDRFGRRGHGWFGRHDTGRRGGRLGSPASWARQRLPSTDEALKVLVDDCARQIARGEVEPVRGAWTLVELLDE
jgi:hypothetical protein